MKQVVTKCRSLRWIYFAFPILFVITLAFKGTVLYGNIAFLIVGFGTEKRYSEYVYRKLLQHNLDFDSATGSIKAIHFTKTVRNDPEKLSTSKIGEHIPCGYLLSTTWMFHGLENKHDVYKGEDCMKKFCASLREHAMKKIGFENKKIYH